MKTFFDWIRFGTLKSSVNNFLYEHKDFSHIDILNIIKQKDIIIGIRPEHTHLDVKENKNAFECEIAVIEALGNEMNVIVESVVDKTRIIVKMLRDDNLSVGQKVYVTFDVNKIHIFDKESENTLLERIPSAMTFKA